MNLIEVLFCILATPGRLVDHLEKTKGFNLRSIKYLVGLRLNFKYNLERSCSIMITESFPEDNEIVVDVLQVMDEADRILNMDFELEVDKILRVIPRERTTYLYSATMTKKVNTYHWSFSNI